MRLTEDQVKALLREVRMVANEAKRHAERGAIEAKQAEHRLAAALVDALATVLPYRSELSDRVVDALAAHYIHGKKFQVVRAYGRES